MDRYEELRTLVAVVESGSFSAAAERLGLAKSAISRRLSDLESRLGVRLLSRTTRRLSPTDAGAALHERARQLLADLEEAESSVSSAQCALSGRLRVTTPHSFGLRHMGEVVATFCKAHPQVQLELELNDRQVDLIENGLDMAVRIGTLTDSTLIARRLNTLRLTTVASPHYLSAHGVPEQPLELEQHQGLIYTLTGRAPWRYRDHNGRLLQPQVPQRLAANNGEHLAAMAVAGLGVAVLPRFIVHDGVASGALVEILLDYQLPEAGLYLVYPPGRFLSRRAREFAEHLAQHLSGSVPWE